jgi:hypothetical protein
MFRHKIASPLVAAVLVLGATLAACSSPSNNEDAGGDATVDTRGGSTRDARGGDEPAADDAPADDPDGSAADAPVADVPAATDLAQIDLPPRPDVPVGEDLPPRPDTRVDDDCAQVTAVGSPVYAPIDIIWAIDTSGSMNEETAIVTEQLNAFVEFIETSGLDVRVVMVADGSVCVPPPLSGSAGCPDTDSDRYLHVRSTVGSTDAYEVLLDAWDTYGPWLRREAIKHFVVVSDDESDRPFAYFREQLATRGLTYFVFHAIVSLESRPAGCTGVFSCEGCTGPHGDAEAEGRNYKVGAVATGGTQASICADDWSATFEGIGENVVSGAVLPCVYSIPDVGGGRLVAYDQVTVRLNTSELSRHETSAGCTTAPGWYYDDNTAPTKIFLCPGVCGAGFEGVEAEIIFGCVKG